MASFLITGFAQEDRPKVRTPDPNAPRVTARKPPAMKIEVARISPGAPNLKRATANVICAGDQVVLRAGSADTSITPDNYAWISTGGKILGTGQEIILDTTNLAPGAYHITGQANYAGTAACSGTCSTYDTTTIRVVECQPEIICFTNPVISLAPESKTVAACETVTFAASDLNGGQGYGKVSWNWSTTAGKIIADGRTARLDTCGLAPGTEIEVSVRALSEFAGCEAKGSARVLIPVPPPPPRELTPCTTFLRNNARVDNACKSVLSDVIRVMQADPVARLVLDSYSNPGEAAAIGQTRGKNVRDRLADGSVGAAIDANRIIVRSGGVSGEGHQVKIWFIPEGATMPSGGQVVDPGPVTPEKRATPTRPQQ
ncbi:MAG: hypothetical protein ACKV2V_30090 [Blastocatellia bacterium]